MGLNGVTQSQANVVPPGAGIVNDARNGLLIATALGLRYVELGGLLLHDTEIFSTSPNLFKLGLLNTPFYIRGLLGANPITGAGSRWAFIPSKQIMYFGSATANEFDFQPNDQFLFIFGSQVIANTNPAGAAFLSVVAGNNASFAALSSAFVVVNNASALQISAAMVVIANSNGASVQNSIANLTSVPAASIDNCIIKASGVIALTAAGSLIIMQGNYAGTTSSIIDSYYHNYATGTKGTINIFDSFIHGKFAQAMTTNGCFYFLPTYSGAVLNETNIVRFQTAAVVVALKVDIADPKLSIGTETTVGLLNLAAGTATKPMIQLTVGTLASTPGNTLQYDGRNIGLKDNSANLFLLNRCRLVMSTTASVILPGDVGGTIYNCTTTKAITFIVGSLLNNGQTIVVKDAAGDALISPITITPDGGKLIDGAASIQVNSNYGSKEIYFDGTNYFTI